MASSSGAENTVFMGWWFMSTRRTFGPGRIANAAGHHQAL
jgi:hypothetical protein